MELNICINEQKTYGVITLSTNFILFSFSGNDISDTYKMLINTADEVCFRAEDDIVYIDFRYEFCDEWKTDI